MKNSTHWAYIAETGTTAGMRILIFVYRHGGPWLFKIFLFPVVCFYFILRGDSRQASEQYLQHVKNTSPTILTITWRLRFSHFWNFALALLDKFAVWSGGITRQHVVVHGIDQVEKLAKQKKGGIIAISHLGNFEICHALSHDHKDIRLTILHHTKHAKKFNRLLNQYMTESNVQLLQVTEMNAAFAMQLSERVGRGEFIAIAADRVPIDNPSAIIQCDFLGEPADFPRGPYVLAAAMSAPLILLTCIKRNGTYHISFEILAEGGKVPRAERENFIRNCANNFARCLESHVYQEPLQWFNFYDFWRKN